MIKALFPESGWIIKLRKNYNRIEIGLYWNDKEIPTHITAIDVKDVIELIEAKSSTKVSWGEQ